MKYYYLEGKKQLGPFNLEQLKNLTLTNETYVWHDELKDWEKLKNLPELRQKLNVINVPPPLPSDIKIKILDEFSKPLAKKSFVETKRKIFRFIVSAILFSFILIGIILIKTSAKTHDDRIAWYIGIPVTLVASLALNHFRKKWANTNEEKIAKANKPKLESEKIDNSVAYIFIVITIALLVIAYNYL